MAEREQVKGVSPSKFMRELRPDFTRIPAIAQHINSMPRHLSTTSIVLHRVTRPMISRYFVASCANARSAQT